MTYRHPSSPIVTHRHQSSPIVTHRHPSFTHRHHHSSSSPIATSAIISHHHPSSIIIHHHPSWVMGDDGMRPHVITSRHHIPSSHPVIHLVITHPGITHLVRRRTSPHFADIVTHRHPSSPIVTHRHPSSPIVTHIVTHIHRHPSSPIVTLISPPFGATLLVPISRIRVVAPACRYAISSRSCHLPATCQGSTASDSKATCLDI